MGKEVDSTTNVKLIPPVSGDYGMSWWLRYNLISICYFILICIVISMWVEFLFDGSLTIEVNGEYGMEAGGEGKASRSGSIAITGI